MNQKHKNFNLNANIRQTLLLASGLKASFQFWSIGFVMLDFDINLISFNLDEIVVVLAVIFSYISGYQYFQEYYKNQ